MNILDIIEEKRDAKELNKEEIEFFVKGYTDGSIPDYQAAALVMAIYINGMTKEETTNLALAMAYSGDVLDLSDIGEVVDKHSTGGIGDKITLILMPIVAALGVRCLEEDWEQLVVQRINWRQFRDIEQRLKLMNL